MGTYDIQGGHFSPQGYFRIDTGGKHDENPNGGIQVGVDNNGTPNVLEEGENVYKDYVYSDNILADLDILKQFNIPVKFAGKLYSEIADAIVDEAEERPLDAVSNNGLNVMLLRLADAQEAQKAQEEQKTIVNELAKLSPEELDQMEMLLTQEAEQQASAPSPEEVAAAQAQEQVPMQTAAPAVSANPMAGMQGLMANGGFLRSFEDGGNKPNFFTRATLGAAMADAPAVMQASGWTYDSDGNLVQTEQDSEGARRLRESLSEIASIPLWEMGAGALSSALEGSKLLSAIKSARTAKGIIAETEKAVKAEQKAVAAAKAIEDATKAAKHQAEVTKNAVASWDNTIASHTKELAAQKEALADLVRQRMGVEKGSEAWVALNKQVEETSNKVNTLARSLEDATSGQAKAVKAAEKAAQELEKLTPSEPAPTTAGSATKPSTTAAAKATPKENSTLGKVVKGTIRTAIDPTYAYRGLNGLGWKKGWSALAATPQASLAIGIDSLPLQFVYDNYISSPEYSSQSETNETIPEYTGRFSTYGGVNEEACGGKINRYDLGGWYVDGKYYPKLYTEDSDTYYPQMLPTFPRYAGVIGSGLLALHDIATPPDRYHFQRAKAHLPYGQMNTRFVPYTPIDVNMLSNQLSAASAGTVRGLRNSGIGPSLGAALLAADRAGTDAIGTGFIKAIQARDQQRNAAIAANNEILAKQAEFNSTLDAMRSRELARAEQTNMQYDMLRQRLNNQAEGEQYAAIGQNLDNLFKGLSGIGKENFIMNQVANNRGLLYHPTLGGGSYYGSFGGFIKPVKKK